MVIDIDAVILASTAMKEAVNRTGDRLGLPNGWLNADFKRTESYSDRLYEASVYYRIFSNILNVRTVAAEYLIAMKLMSGRRYKNDISDIYGILLEHKRNGAPISRTAVDNAVTRLYGDTAALPEASRALIDKAYENGDYEIADCSKLGKHSHCFLSVFRVCYYDRVFNEPFADGEVNNAFKD
jgi:hypothetical protein